VTKSSKPSVDYERTGRPEEHCGPASPWPVAGECRHFEPPVSCEKVQGTISPRGWCRLWKHK